MRNETTPDSVLNCFGDENWSNPWIRPNRHPSRRCYCTDSWRWCCADSNVLEEFLDLGIFLFLYNGGGQGVRQQGGTSGGHGQGTSHLPFFIYYLYEVTFFHLSYFLLGGGARVGGGPVGERTGRGEGGTGRGLPSGRRSWLPTSMPIPAANATGTR
jgi:hypothetical protein